MRQRRTPAKYKPLDLPVRGDRAGRDWADSSVLETELERLRQQALADERQRLIERLRRAPDA